MHTKLKSLGLQVVDHSEELRVDEMIILKGIFNKKLGSGHGLITGFCKEDNEFTGSIKNQNLLTSSATINFSRPLSRGASQSW